MQGPEELGGNCLNTMPFVKVGPMVRLDRNVSCVMSDKQIRANFKNCQIKTHKTQTFMEIDHEIISTVILLPLIQDGLLSVTSMCMTSSAGNRFVKLAQENSVVRITDCPNMTLAIDWVVKQ